MIIMGDNLLNLIKSATTGSVNNKAEINKQIRVELNNILNAPPSPREIEIDKILKQEAIKYHQDKDKFYAGPMHWSNNKRRRMGLPTLRGIVNKNRSTQFHEFNPAPRVFFLIEDIIEETVNGIINDQWFDKFVDVKTFPYGDRI